LDAFSFLVSKKSSPVCHKSEKNQFSEKWVKLSVCHYWFMFMDAKYLS